MKKYLLLLILLAAGAERTEAQILNFNKYMLQNDSLKWLGLVGLNFILIDQEVQVFNMGANFNVVRKFRQHSILAISKFSFASSNKELLLSDGYLHARMIFNRKKRVGEEVFYQIQYNAIRGLQERNLAGGGLRFWLFDNDNYAMILGIGAMMEWEEWAYQDSYAVTSVFKSTNYLSLFADVSPNFNFNVISYYQARYDTFFKPRISLEINLNLKITSKLKFTSNLTMFYDNVPLVPIDNFVYRFKNGLTYHF